MWIPRLQVPWECGKVGLGPTTWDKTSATGSGGRRSLSGKTEPSEREKDPDRVAERHGQAESGQIETDRMFR